MSFAFCGLFAQTETSFRSVSVDEFEKAISDTEMTVLDVRMPVEYKEGHLPGTDYNIDVLEDDFTQEALKVLPKEKTVALYCRSGNRSKKAARILSENGYQVIELATGFLGWYDAGKPVEKGFVVYDCLGYPGKPDLTDDGLSKIRLIYEFRLLSSGLIDKDKINACISEANDAGVKAISIDIESWYWDKNYSNQSLKDSLQLVYDLFREGVPDAHIGNYGVPIGNVNIARYVEGMEDKSDDEIMEVLHQNNNRLAAGEVSDVLYPSLYIYGPDIDQWIKDLKLTVDYIRKYYPQKKIVGYIWSQYYNWNTSPYYMQFISEDKFLKMLEAAYEYLDGVVLWAHGRDTDNKTYVRWDDERVQAIYSAIKTFTTTHRITSADR